MLSNLVANGIKYSRSDVAPVVAVTAGEETVDGKKYHTVSVKDNGIGFEQRYEQRIFELFQRLHGKTEFAGTGIGLAICKKIAEHHKGFIRARSSPGEGSVFTVYLPAKK
jgi:signal transduction histidine kinase